MAAENVLVLKKKAVAAGMDKKVAMKASRPELEKFLSGSGSKPAKKKKTGAKKSTTPAPAKKKTAKKKTTTPAKATKPKTAPKSKSKPKSKVKSSEGGRNMLDGLDYTQTDGWNPREGSPVNDIFRAIKKAKGNVDKATDALFPDAKLYVGTKKQDGTKRTKDEMRAALRYRVNRTKWEFAMRTGQHEASANRIEYGTGAHATAKKKSTRKATAKKTAAKPKTAKKTAKKKTAKKK